VVGGDAVRLGALGVSLVPDHYPGEGPLGGILTALAAATEELVVVVACDMPGVGPAVPLALAASLAAATQSGVAVAVVGEREQPLTACWRRSIALGPLQAAFDRGVRAPRHVLAELNAVRVEGLPVSQLVDVDSPDDLRRYADRHPGPDREEEDTP
jgi:molybdopterin-guanine dinucleotide biosynthesis protein A